MCMSEVNNTAAWTVSSVNKCNRMSKVGGGRVLDYSV